MALRDWVGSNVKYKHDSDVHGMEEYWQLSKETIGLKTGDCEDSAILLCSLLRAAGYSSNDVFIALGESSGEGHAWVSFKWIDLFGLESWIRLEPTTGGNIVTSFFADLLSTFENRPVNCLFNDIYYNE